MINREGGPYVAMKSVAEGMGLDWNGQHLKLMNDVARWGVVMMTIVQAGDGKEREMTVLPAQTAGLAGRDEDSDSPLQRLCRVGGK
jgi:hypothetical protein